MTKPFVTVNKKGILHKFVSFDAETDVFTSSGFQNWENETFDIFESVQDKEGIAIDLGAWIGTTSIWLSKHFHHVLAVEPDRVSIECLQKNLEASECPNVTICKHPVAATTHPVFFGPRGPELNRSISIIKSCTSNPNDYQVNPLTLKQLVDDYIFSHKTLSSHKISFIKCDIEGGEEPILRDLLQFAYFNSCKIFLSFHFSWWGSKDLSELEHLLPLFKTNCPSNDICTYIIQNPFTSILFEPINLKVLLTNDDALKDIDKRKAIVQENIRTFQKVFQLLNPLTVLN